MIVYLNGAYVEEREAVVPVSDRGFLFGDGVFEAARLYHGGYFRLEEHLARLDAGAELLRLEPPDHETLTAVAHELRDRDAVRDGTLRIIVTRGSGGTGLGTRGAGPLTVLAMLRPLPEDWRERAGRGWRAITARIRHPTPAAAPQRLKGQGRIFSLLAKLEAETAGVDEALLLSTDDFVAEGGTWNVFWREGARLRTPAPDVGILTGVTRGVVMGLAAAEGLRVEEGAWGREALDDADEIFATMSSRGLVPIVELDGRAYPPGPACAALAERYWALVGAEVGTAP